MGVGENRRRCGRSTNDGGYRVGLKTNRRVDRISKLEGFDAGMTSAWNKKKEALDATIKLIDRLPVKYIVLSYNDEGLIEQEALFNALKAYKNVDIQTIDYKRNIMSSIGNATKYQDKFDTANKEFVIVIEKWPDIVKSNMKQLTPTKINKEKTMSKKSSTKQTVRRSSKTGQFVTKKFAETHKSTTETQHIKKQG